MIKLESKNNYLFVALETGNVYSGLSTNFEFQQDGANFDLVFKNNIIANDVPFSGFSDETNTPFANVEAFKDFYSAYSGTISPALTNEELRASAVVVSIENQIDLSAIEGALIDTNIYLQGIAESTTDLETYVTTIISYLNTNASINHADLLNVILELQGLDANTDEIETKLTSIITNTNSNATSGNQVLTNSKLDTLNAKDFSTSGKQDLLLTEVKAKTTTTATTTLATTTASQSAISSNANRRKVIFENSGNQRVYLKFGSASSSASYTYSLGQNEKLIELNFNGQVFANTGAGSSNLQITELTL